MSTEPPTWFNPDRAKKALYRENFRRRSDLLMAMTLRLGVLISVGFSFATLCVAFYHLYEGIVHACGESHSPAKLIGAVEIFLICPLPYLVLRSLGRYAEDFYYYQALKPSTRGSLIDTKCFMVGLLFTMLIANFVGRFITEGFERSETKSRAPTVQIALWQIGESSSQEIEKIQARSPSIMNIEDSVFGCAVLLILILFYHRLEVAHRESLEHESDEDFLKRVEGGKSRSP